MLSVGRGFALSECFQLDECAVLLIEMAFPLGLRAICAVERYVGLCNYGDEMCHSQSR